MNAMLFVPSLSQASSSPASSTTTRSILDRAALAYGAAKRRARIQDIETDIDLACEQAALGRVSNKNPVMREAWDGRAWDRYLEEAIRQSRLRKDEIAALRKETELLERLLQVAQTRP